MIERKKYMSLLEKWRDKKVIKVVTGVRRCGKSSLLRMFREKLSDNGVEERFSSSTLRTCLTNHFLIITCSTHISARICAVTV